MTFLCEVSAPPRATVEFGEVDGVAEVRPSDAFVPPGTIMLLHPGGTASPAPALRSSRGGSPMMDESTQQQSL